MIARLQQSVLTSSGWTRVVVAFAAGSLSVLAMAPFFFSPVLFLTLPVLVWLIDASRRNGHGAAKRAAFVGWWFGFGYFLFGLFWIGEAFLVEADKFAWALPFAVTLLPAGLALFIAAAAAAASFFWPAGLARVLVLAVALALAEWLRGHVLTGLPWNVLGYALTFPVQLMQMAAVLGVYGLTLWAVAIFAAPLVMVADAARSGRANLRMALIASLWALLPLAAAFVYGAFQLGLEPGDDVAGVKFRIVQPSVPQREKWLPEKQGTIFRDHLDLSRLDAAGRVDQLAGVTHLIWPEAAMPFLPLETPAALDAIAELLPDGSYLLTGALRREPANAGVALPPATRRAYNSLMAFGPDGVLAALYDKIHLVPFGEYLPFQPALESIGLQQLTRLRGGFGTGAEPRPILNVPGLPRVGALICYEAIFPAAVVQGAERPGLLVNVTNDGWFGNTTGPRQHFHQARVRAVEEGLPLVRAANNGISAVIDSNGRVRHRLDLNVRGVIDSALPAAKPVTVYGRYGDYLFFINLLVFAGLAATRINRRDEVPEPVSGSSHTG